MRAALLLLAMLATGCTAYQQRIGFGIAGATVSGLIACDNRETVHVSDHGRWDRIAPATGAHLYEVDPALGHTPSVELLDAAAIAATGITMLIATSDRVPNWAKISYLVIVGAAEIETTVSNHQYAPGACW